jgi:glycosyltransferase involved in cell wall biosynthesis
LIHALAGIKGATLLLVGDGSEWRSLEELARSVGVAGRVVWAGWSDDPRSYLGSLDVFALPSRFEGFPLVVLEGLLARSAVIASALPRPPGTARRGCSSRLRIPRPGDAIRRLLADGELRQRLVEQGRRLVLESFTAGRMSRAFESFYDELLN